MTANMATTLPAKLKGELQRFATRAVQLQQFRPIVSYWCEYYILQQILAKSYHANDKETEAYAVHLMDKLEQKKAENPANDAIVDDVAAKAYMENFALDTFNRGDEAQRNNKVTKQTADTFMAAATFMDLLSIWGEVDKEITAKSKFAKFHAARILKALKAGEDPNATNPVVEEPVMAEDGVDDELRTLERQEDVVGDAGVYQPPTVESAPDSGLPSRPQSVRSAQAPMPPPPIDTASPNGAAPPANANEPDVSPIEPAESSNARQGSIGGGYFPEVPSAPADHDVDMVEPAQPPLPPPPVSDPQDFYSTQTPPLNDPTAPSPGSLGVDPNRPGRPPPEQMGSSPSAAPWLQPPPPHIQAQLQQQRQQPPPQAPVPAPAPAPAPAPTQAPTGQPTGQPTGPPARTGQGPPPGGYNTDDESTMAAQKHARWAISALNFEDVNTAVKELRLALGSLGST